MGGRYYLTGTQLGMLKAYCQIAKTEPAKTLQTLEFLEELLEEIEDKQFIGDIPEYAKSPYDYEIVIRKKVKQNEKEK